MERAFYGVFVFFLAFAIAHELGREGEIGVRFPKRGASVCPWPRKNRGREGSFSWISSFGRDWQVSGWGFVGSGGYGRAHWNNSVIFGFLGSWFSIGQFRGWAWLLNGAGRLIRPAAPFRRNGGIRRSPFLRREGALRRALAPSTISGNGEK